VRRLTLVLVGLWLIGCDNDPPPTPPAPPATKPATQPAVVEEVAVEPIDYAEFVRQLTGDASADLLASAQPVEAAGRFEMPTRPLIDPRGVPWFRHDEGRPIRDILADAEAWKASEWLVQEDVVWAWIDRNPHRSWAITRDTSGYTWHHGTGQTTFNIEDPDWTRAMIVGRGLAVPTENELVVLRLKETPDDIEQFLRRHPDPANRPAADGIVTSTSFAAEQFVPTDQGLIAWTGSEAASYDDASQTWTAGTSAPADIVHVVPLVGQSALLILDDGRLARLDGTEPPGTLPQGILPMPGDVEVQGRFGQTGVLLRLAGGVEVEETMGLGVIKRPGFVVVRPGYFGLLPDRLARRVERDATVRLFGGDYVIETDDTPPRRWGINHFQSILPEHGGDAYTKTLHRDARGRWYFGGKGESVLVLDPRLRLSNDQLPVWVHEVGRGGPLNLPGIAGESAQGWPAMQLGGTWAIDDTGWTTLQDESMLTTRSDTVTETSIDGVTFAFTNGTLIGSDGTSIDVAEAPDDPQPTPLIAGPDGLVYLFPGDGSVVRVDPAGDQPTKRFEELLPEDAVRHAWVDPVGRICVAFDEARIAILWPDGIVPPEIRRLMPVQRRGGGGPRRGV
jgi:hypothetical protein